MTVLIVEDEVPAAKRLQAMLAKAMPEATISRVLDSVAGTIDYLRKEAEPDLIFLDIQLADGESFDILEAVPIRCPVIFTTAYDQYTLQAFKVNSIDYLLKPLDERDLERAITQFRTYALERRPLPGQWSAFLESVRKPSYKERFMIRSGEEFRFIQVSDIQYLYSEQGMVYAQLNDRRKFHLDFTLDQLDGMLNPDEFFRINRKFIIRLAAIDRIFTYFNSRLKLEVTPAPPFDLIVSRDRVPDFKHWIDR